MMLSARIGAIELDDNEVRLAVVKTGGRQPAVLERHAEPVSFDSPDQRAAAYVDALKALKSRVKSKPATYVLCASSRYGVVRSITVPFKGRRRVSAAVRFELEPYLAFPIEDLVVDYVPIREIEGQTQVLAVGMRRGPLEGQLAMLEEAGFNPEAIGLDATGLTALWQSGRKPAPGLNAVLHVRQKGSILAVTNGKDLAFFRHLPLTLAQMHENPGGAARDVQNSLRAFRMAWDTGDDAAGLTVTGVELFEDERRLFDESFRIPVTYENLGDRAKYEGKRDKQAPPEESREGNVWEALVGTAVAASGGANYALDFRQGDLASPNAVRGLVQHAVFSLAIGLLALLGYVVYMVIDHRHNVDELNRISGEMWQIFTETFPDSPRAADGRPPNDPGGQLVYSYIEEAIAESGLGGQRMSLDLFLRPTFLDILAEIGRKMPDSKVSMIRLRYELPRTAAGSRGAGPRIQVDGRATPEAYSQVLNDLNTSALLVVDGEPSVQSDEGGRVKFTITLALKEDADAET